MDELLSLGYFGLGASPASLLDFSVLRRDLVRRGPQLVSPLLDEIKENFDKSFGTDTTTWKEVKVFPVIQKGSLQIVNRIFVGLPLCRDSRYLRPLFWWEIGFAVFGFLLRLLVPEMTRPFLGHVIAAPVHVLRYLATRKVIPEICDRLRKEELSTNSGGTWDKPNDVVQWMIDSSGQQLDGAAIDPVAIAGRQMILNLFGQQCSTSKHIRPYADILFNSRTYHFNRSKYGPVRDRLPPQCRSVAC